MAPYVSDIGSSLMRTFSPDSDALRLLAGYASGALALGETSSMELQATVAQHLRDLLAILLGTQGDARELSVNRGVRAARLRAIKGQVIAQLGHGELSAESVAIPLRITANYVRKLLHAEGISFSDYVLGLRLERTFAMLRDRRLADRAISWIAFDAGFNDISYFNRSFRKRYGMTPGDVRHGVPHTLA